MNKFLVFVITVLISKLALADVKVIVKNPNDLKLHNIKILHGKVVAHDVCITNFIYATGYITGKDQPVRSYNPNDNNNCAEINISFNQQMGCSFRQESIVKIPNGSTVEINISHLEVRGTSPCHNGGITYKIYKNHP